MRELLPGVWMWSRLSPPHGYDFNGFLVEHAAANLVIDPVEPDPQDLEAVGRRGAAAILLTNRNHGRAANAVRSVTGAQTLIHDADREHAAKQGTLVDGALAVGQRKGPFEVVDASGKSPGEVAFFWPERRLLFVGDAIIGWPAGKCSLLPEAKLDDPARLKDSVRRLLMLDFDTLLTGDGVPLLGQAKPAVRDMVSGWE